MEVVSFIENGLHCTLQYYWIVFDPLKIGVRDITLICIDFFF